MSEVTQDQEKEREKQDKEMYDEDLLIRALHEEDLDLFRSEFVHLHSYDQAKFFSKIDEDLRNRLYHYLSPEEMAELLKISILMKRIIKDPSRDESYLCS